MAGAGGCLVGDRFWHRVAPWGRWSEALAALALVVSFVAWSKVTMGKANGAQYQWRGKVIFASVVVSMFVLTTGRAAVARAGVEQGVVASLAGSGTWVSVRGRVMSEIERSGNQLRFSLRSDAIWVGNRTWRLTERITVLLPSQSMLRAGGGRAAEVGTEVLIGGLIGRPPPAMREWALRERSLGTLKAEEFETVGSAPRWLAATTAVRQFLRSGAENSLDGEDSGLLLGLMYGDTAGMSRESVARFRKAGLSHLTAVSGQNFALVMCAIGALIRLIPALWPRRRLRSAILIAAAMWFVALTRWEPSVLRAGAMAVVLLLGLSLGIRVGVGEVVAVGGLAALVIDPMLAHSVGFQLSIAATLAIAFWALPISEVLRRYVRLPRCVALPAAVALTAEIGVAPVIAAHFGTIQLLSVPANMAAVPAAGFASVWGYPACLVSALIPSLGELLHLGTKWPLQWTRAVATTASGLPGAEVHIGKVPWAAAGAAYAVQALGMAFVTRRLARGRRAAPERA